MSVATPLTMPSSSTATGPRPLQLVDGNLPPAISNSCSPTVTSPRSSQYGLSTPPHSARSFKPNPRRQSSISYFPSDHVSLADVRSPTMSRTKTGLKRSNSLGIKTDMEETVSRMKGDRRSLVIVGSSKEPMSPGPAVERGPLTLTERHADLLQFIAQKEAKCLELRSQLAAHEAELAQLKRKWERIISRGMDRAYSSSSSSPLLASSVPAGTVPAAAVSSIIPTASTAIKEGVRLLAAGLDLVPSDELSSPQPPISPAAKGTTRHTTTQSMSSVSTTASSSTVSSSSTAQTQRLSQSSASSLTTALSLEDVTEEDSMKGISIAWGLEESTTQVEITPARSPELVKLRRRSREGQTLGSQATSTQAATDSSERRAKPRPSSVGLPPAASIPGLGPLPTPVSSWMGSVGKKLTEIQRGETFTKSQKRASLLLSDVSHSIISALSVPSTPLPVPSPRVSSTPGLSPVPSPSAVSLLEDDNSDDNGKNLGDILIPTPSPAPSPSPVRSNDDDEDWNW